MPLTNTQHEALALEECLDEVNDFFDTLQRYTPAVLAVALRIHLEGLLQVLIEARECTPGEVREFVRGLEREALQYDEG
jgi:hypothetical protein